RLPSAKRPGMDELHVRGALPKNGRPRRQWAPAPATLLSRFVCFFDFGAVDQLDEGHGGVVALAEAHLQHTGVAAVARFVARADFVEQLGHRSTITQTGESQAL